ncbi:MAG: ABC transporter permease, partial [Leclercia adecarboxylata]|nr:ABC transporter permease [Leclercia adecarboxylata]
AGLIFLNGLMLALPIITLLVVVTLTGFIMNKTSIGRMIYAMGGNREAASRMGFGIFKMQLFVYGYMGLMSGVAGVVQSATVLTVAPDSLLGYELTVLAAVVLGGTSIVGGRGTLLGTLLGVILLAMIQNGLNLLGISSYWHTVVTGVVIVTSISMTAWSQRKGQGALA